MLSDLSYSWRYGNVRKPAIHVLVEKHYKVLHTLPKSGYRGEPCGIHCDIDVQAWRVCEVYLSLNADRLLHCAKEQLMTMWFKQIGLFLLLIAGMTDSFAGPGGQRRDEPRGAAFHAQNIALERGESRADQQVRPQGELRRSGQFGLPDASGYGAQMSGGTNVSDYPRRQGRMTPEERRALRQQIDEVGHDIYAPKR